MERHGFAAAQPWSHPEQQLTPAPQRCAVRRWWTEGWHTRGSGSTFNLGCLSLGDDSSLGVPRSHAILVSKRGAGCWDPCQVMSRPLEAEVGPLV